MDYFYAWLPLCVIICMLIFLQGSWIDFQQWVKESKTKRSAKSRLALALTSTVHKVADSRKEAKAFWTTTQSWGTTPFNLSQQAKDVFGIQVSRRVHSLLLLNSLLMVLLFLYRRE